MKKRNTLMVVFMAVFVALYFWYLCDKSVSEGIPVYSATGLWWYDFIIMLLASTIPSKWIADKICHIPMEHTFKYSFVKWTLYVVIALMIGMTYGYIMEFYGFGQFDLSTWTEKLIMFVIAAIVISIINKILPKFIKK